MQEMGVQSLDWEDPQEEEMGTGTTVLAWRIPWTEEPGGLQSTGLKELDMTEWVCVCAHTHTHTELLSSTKARPFWILSWLNWIGRFSSWPGVNSHYSWPSVSAQYCSFWCLSGLFFPQPWVSFLPCMHWPALLNSQGGPFADLWDSLLFVNLPTLSCEFQPSCSPWTHRSISSAQGICWTHLWFPFPFHHL